MQLRNKNLPTQNKLASLFGKQKREGLEKETKADIHLETVPMPGDVMDIKKPSLKKKH